MREYEEKLRKYILENSIDAEQFVYEDICHSAEDAAVAAGTTLENIVKNICLVDPEGNLIVAILKGDDKFDLKKITEFLSIKKLKTATPEQILEKTGYICGGVPSFSYPATFIIDTRVMESDFVFTGGGSQFSLVKISPEALKKANSGNIVDIRK